MARRQRTVAKRSLVGNPEETLWSMSLVNAMNWRKKFTQESLWNEIDAIYMHQYGDNIPHFNLVFMLAQTLIPNMVFQAPGIINTPNRPGMVQWASLWDSVDNWWVDHAEIKDIAQEAVLDAYLHNISTAFIGYDFDNKVEQDMREVAGAVDRTRATNAAWVDLIPSHRVLYATGTRKLRNCPWVAKFVSTPTKVLTGRNLSNVKASPVPADIMVHEQALWEFRDKSKYTCFWQIHDAETKKWCWLSTNGKFIMGWEDDPYQIDGLPCETLILNKNPLSIWGTSDPTYIMSQHLEGDDVRWQALKQRRLGVSKFLYDSNCLDEEDVLRLTTSNAPGAIPVNLEGDKSMKDSVMELTGVANYTHLYEAAKNILNDAQLITGTGPNQMGTFAPGRRSATEANIVEGVSTSRVGNRRAEVGAFIEGLVNKNNKLCAQNWTQPVVQQVLGYNGALYWVEADPKGLEEAGFGVTTQVNVESLAPVSRERRKQEAAELLGMLSTMTEAGVNPMPVLKQFLSQFEWIDVRQVLPQMEGQIPMDTFIQEQQAMIAQGGVGPQAQQNIQGVQSLIQRLPSEAQNTGENNESE